MKKYKLRKWNPDTKIFEDSIFDCNSYEISLDNKKIKFFLNDELLNETNILGVTFRLYELSENGYILIKKNTSSQEYCKNVINKNIVNHIDKDYDIKLCPYCDSKKIEYIQNNKFNKRKAITGAVVGTVLTGGLGGVAGAIIGGSSKNKPQMFCKSCGETFNPDEAMSKLEIDIKNKNKNDPTPIIFASIVMIIIIGLFLWLIN